MINTEKVIIGIRFIGKIKWYRSEPDFWVLDYNKAMSYYDHMEPEKLPNIKLLRFGMDVVNELNAAEFLACLSDDLVDKDKLSYELYIRYQKASEYRDLLDLFPVMFIDFDRRHVDVVPGNVDFLAYIPDGWTGSNDVFYDKYDDIIFPDANKFWKKGNIDLFKQIAFKSKL